MCGIAGSHGDTDPTLVAEMTAAVRHRGPDAIGYHTAGGVRLGSARLSIIDVDGGNQPIYDETGRICAVVNGEIYNHRELRGRLSARGHRFATGSDSEVVVHLYEEYGERFVEHLRGMFAVAIADGERLLLARDRLGIKPLHYTVVPGTGTLLFASEIKALLRCPEVPAELDPQAFADQAVLSYAVGDRTLLAGIRSVPPGHVMSVTPGERGARIARAAYRPPAGPPADPGPDPWSAPGVEARLDAAAEELLDLLRETVRLHLVADVEVGLTLSGGLDSALLAVLMREVTGRPFRVYSVADRPGHPDAVQAARIADWLDCPRRLLVPTFRDYVSAIPRYVLAEEAPSGLGCVPLYLLSARIGADLKVCLNGEGADELFGGYPEYLGDPNRARYARRNLAVLESLGLRPSERAREIAEVLTRPEPIEARLAPLFALNMREELVLHHLEPVDKCAMAHGVEVRVPYMDHVFADHVTALPVEWRVDPLTGVQKGVLKRAALRACGGSGPLVDSVLRRKIGGPAAASRYRAMLDRLCEEILPEDYTERHELGRCFPKRRELLVFELFQEIFMTHRGVVPDGFSFLDFIHRRAGARPTREPAALMAD